ncbi:hypothetical protein PN462_07770 [Spirulina sp. CS-785/01]|uniref:hypothetical protein n=1 Tax=Spirulina sp. CS-785/01 TaxID=3021716 RepID=UPI00232DE676|nr:hypothetical protein [Spirulina sp. CS-785/01]MDB9312995.1 hypothetical protein [Spirulina sp. CS-785/01]
MIVAHDVPQTQNPDMVNNKELPQRLQNLEMEIKILQATLSQTRSLAAQDESPPWQQKINTLTRRLERMKEMRDRWLDELEAPHLRQRVRFLENKVLHLRNLNQQLKGENEVLQKKQDEFEQLTEDHQFLHTLYQEQLKNVAVLSLHKHQNLENYTKLVLDIGRRLEAKQIPVIAKAHKAELQPDGEYCTKSGLNAYGLNPQIDQVVFPLYFRHQKNNYILMLLVRANTTHFQDSPLSVVLYHKTQSKTVAEKNFELFHAEKAVNYFAEFYVKYFRSAKSQFIDE